MLRMGYLTALIVLSAFANVGCTTPFTEKAANGIVFYCPGAGNFDMGDRGLRKGLGRAGFDGQVATVIWTVSFNPAIDQAVKINARLGGNRLSKRIKEYIDTYPNKPVSVVGLSAGSGVAVWALEDLPAGYRVDNVVLLASSLYHRYDLRKASTHVAGKIYNYHSSYDAILAGPMKVFGTIDGIPAVDAGGAVGFHPPRGVDNLVNIPYRKSYSTYGNYGGHTDGTNPNFIEKVVSRNLLPIEQDRSIAAIARPRLRRPDQPR